MLPLLMAARAGSSGIDYGKIIAFVAAAGIGVGGFIYVRKVVINAKVKGIQKRALEPNNPASAAIQIKMAFENDNYMGWGTDEELLFNVLEDISSQAQMQQVQKAYRNLYQTELVADLQSELDVMEFSKALQIIRSKM